MYAHFLSSLVQEMLLRRTCKLVEFENASKALEKAKPKNQEQVKVIFCFTSLSEIACAQTRADTVPGWLSGSRLTTNLKVG